ncbi:hypothetical protein PENSPDRAFT_652020 [Peniophora sp. CONT]|nr:hypothetical protein PENSPDRAFT_652020 [Peniophora sp. CONT]
MPPPGGFGQVQYKRNLSLRGPSGIVILGGMLALTIYGFHRVALGRAERQELEREKAWSRIHLVPMLLAEGDRDAFRRTQAALAREKLIMKDVEGWEAGKSVYNNPKHRNGEWVVPL